MRYRWHGTTQSQTDRYPGRESRVGRTVQGGGRRPSTTTTAGDPAAEHVVIQDQAGFHPRAGDAGLPDRIHLLPLPPYSPELNTIEGLWDQVQDVTCNHRHESLDDLEQTLTSALRPFWESPARVLSLIHHWLRAQANATP